MTEPESAAQKPSKELVAQAIALLKAIDDGSVTVSADGETWKETYAGDVKFTTSNGWKITVFNDCDSWDYIDSIRSPEGEVIDFDYMWNNCIELSGYSPKNPEAWGIEGRGGE
jgi:hypothetical protein